MGVAIGPVFAEGTKERRIKSTGRCLERVWDAGNRNAGRFLFARPSTRTEKLSEMWCNT